MRLSRPRLLLRAALLVFLAGFMAWRGHDTGLAAAAPGLDPGGARLLSRVALLEWILGGLALLTAGAALLSLRTRPAQPSLRLRGAAGEPGGGDEKPPPAGR